MKILVANLGSTSLKYRLFRFEGGAETVIAGGSSESVRDHGRAIEACLEILRTTGHLASPGDLDAVAFKVVMGGELTGSVLADEKVEKALLAFADLAPAHNPPYASGISLFRQRFPGVPLVAVFETAFYQWMPDYARRYAVPESWHAIGVRRYGFHGASHKYVAERSAELLGRPDIAAISRHLYQDGPRVVPGAPLRVISCHLGGSSSITAIVDGLAVDTSMGLTPQSGLPQNNRVGDLDPAALAFAHRRLKLTPAAIQRQLATEGGLLGLSGVSSDLRAIRSAALQGNRRAEMATDVLVHSIRHWVGAFWFELGGCDALVFTGGIGEHHPWLREMVCAGLSELGLSVDPDRNAAGLPEADLSSPESQTRVFVIPAQEELVVAREAHHLLEAATASA